MPPLQVLLLTDDADNRRKAAELGIQAVSTLVSAFAGGDGWWGWLGSALWRGWLVGLAGTGAGPLRCSCYGSSHPGSQPGMKA